MCSASVVVSNLHIGRASPDNNDNYDFCRFYFGAFWISASLHACCDDVRLPDWPRENNCHFVVPEFHRLVLGRL